jgi:hypothetical protein
MIGIMVLAYIRYIQKPDRLNDTKASDGWIILLIFTILLTGYFIEGLRIAAQIQLSTTMAQIAYERVCSPFGWMFAALFGGMHLDSILIWHRCCGGSIWRSRFCLLQLYRLPSCGISLLEWSTMYSAIWNLGLTFC